MKGVDGPEAAETRLAWEKFIFAVVKTRWWGKSLVDRVKDWMNLRGLKSACVGAWRPSFECPISQKEDRRLMLLMHQEYIHTDGESLTGRRRLAIWCWGSFKLTAWLIYAGSTWLLPFTHFLDFTFYSLFCLLMFNSRSAYRVSQCLVSACAPMCVSCKKTLRNDYH